MRHLLVALSGATIFMSLAASSGAAQGTGTADPRRTFASRDILAAQAAQAEAAAASEAQPEATRELKRAESLTLRYRLEEGDFSVGDRVVVVVMGEPDIGDTAVVRSGKTVQLGKLPTISLDGVLRSELEDHLTRELSRYVREPRVTAVPLLRIAVFGSVARPGYLHVPADLLLSDLLMSAGGPAANANLQKAELRRGPDVFIGARSVQVALAGGSSLDDLHLRSGDEFHVPEKRNMNWTTVMQAAGVVTGLVSIAYTLAR